MKNVRLGFGLVVLCFGALITAGGACSVGGGGGAGGCADDGDCQPSSTSSTSGTAGSGSSTASTGGGSCTASGDSCTDNGQCCNFRAGTGFCEDYSGESFCDDSCAVDSDCTSGCCTADSSGNLTCSPASFCQSGIDQACDSDANCSAGLCTTGGGWCTQPCTSSNDCPGGWCALNSSNDAICFPLCGSNADCDQLPASGVYCHSASTVDDGEQNICST